MKNNNKAALIPSKPDNHILIEVLAVMLVSLLFRFTLGGLSNLSQLVPIIYFLVERQKRNRSFQSVGFKLKNTLKDLKDNWYWVVLVTVIFQFLIALTGKFLLSDYIAHVKERAPVSISTSALLSILLTILIGTFLEEITYRSLFQERLSWFMKPAYAVIAASLLFGIMHYSPGPVLVVALDIFGVFIDSIVYGIIFHKTKNIFASYVAHFTADIVGVMLMLTLL